MQPDVQLHIYFLFIGKTFFHIEKPLLHPLQVWKFSVTHPTMEGGLIQHFADVKPPFQQWRSKGGTGRAVRPGQQELWGRRSPPTPALTNGHCGAEKEGIASTPYPSLLHVAAVGCKRRDRDGQQNV